MLNWLFKRNSFKIRRLQCDVKLHSLISDGCVMYVESKDNPGINSFFMHYYDLIDKMFQSRGRIFIYVPAIVGDMRYEQTTVLNYYRPNIVAEDVERADFSPQMIYDKVLSYFAKSERKKIKAGLLALPLHSGKKNRYTIAYSPINNQEYFPPLWRFVEEYIVNP